MNPKYFFRNGAIVISYNYRRRFRLCSSVEVISAGSEITGR